LPVKLAASWASVWAAGVSARILATAASWSGSVDGHCCCVAGEVGARAGAGRLVAASDF
jgi:hypothetical protein